MLDLIGIAAGAGYFGMQYCEQNRALHVRYDAAVVEALEEPIAMIQGHDWNTNTLIAMKSMIPQLMEQG